MIQNLIILGTGGSAYDVLDIVDALNAQSPVWHVLGFLDDAHDIGTTHAGFPILGRLTDAGKFPEAKFINVIGSEKTYARRAEIIASTGLSSDAFATLIHPMAAVSDRATLGSGSYLCFGASIGGAARVGEHVSISPCVRIGHDAYVESYTVLSPGACIGGHVKIAQSAFIGACASIRPLLKVGSDALVGMGAMVVRDVDPSTVVAGCPAKLLRRITTAAASGLPRIDIIMPCYKYGHFLEAAVQTVLDQAGVDVRILIIDDCSPDDTEAVGTAIAKRDNRVEFRRHQINRGHIATYNEGIEWVSGKYMLLLSADDLLTPGSLRRAVDLMEANPSVAMVYGDAIKTENPEAHRIEDDPQFTTNIAPGAEFLEAACATAENLVPTPTAIIRSEIQKRVGGYRRDLLHSGDFEMWMRIAAFGDIGVVHAIQAFYRMHGKNMSSAYPMLRDITERKASFDALFDVFGPSIDQAARLKHLAITSLAESTFWLASHAFDDGKGSLSRQYLDLACSLDPALKQSKIWKRFRLKRAVGHHVWNILRPLIIRARGGQRDRSEGYKAAASLVVQG